MPSDTTNGGSVGPSPAHGLDTPSALSTHALEQKLKKIKEESEEHSQVLTQKLASSQSGQNLLHIGNSLSTLPPSLHSMLTQLHPVLTATEEYEKTQMNSLKSMVSKATEIRAEQRRAAHAQAAADLYADLVAAETCVQRDARQRVDPQIDFDLLEHAASLERAAHITLCLVEDLQAANEVVTKLTQLGAGEDPESQRLPNLHNPLPEDSEQAQFLLKLAPRIRRLETDVAVGLMHHMESVLKATDALRDEDGLLQLGHVMRGLALLGRGKDVENTFARVSILPLVRAKLSMGRLDEGGSRGECKGLPSLLDEILEEISNKYTPILVVAESMFRVGDHSDVDLLTAGVWVPLATALLTDTGIRMTIFSPGIASVLQANYMALDAFLGKLAGRLLRDEPPTESSDLFHRPILGEQQVIEAQERIYSHSKTAEFSRKWNLPIYYQLRFGESCSRLNKAIDATQRDGWIAEVYSGTHESSFRDEIGFELPLFLEFYDVLLTLWRPDVILRPLANRFLRGSIQLMGRLVHFIKDGMDGKIKFGAVDEPAAVSAESAPGDTGLDMKTPPRPMRQAYCWGESEQEVAAVAWELSILESHIRHDYVDVIVNSLATEADELRTAVEEALQEAASQMRPTIENLWNELIVRLLLEKCSGPLSAVKGVAATYRMTNRPPPKEASPFVSTIMRPLKEFDTEFSSRVPDLVGTSWKISIVSAVTARYATAVAELLLTVERTEAALKSRKARKTATGSMSDGEKVKLQVYLDYVAFSSSVEACGVPATSIDELSQLQELTSEGASLLESNANDF